MSYYFYTSPYRYSSIYYPSYYYPRSYSRYYDYLDYLPPVPSYTRSSSSTSGDANRLLAELIYTLGKNLIKLNDKVASLFGHKDFYPAELFKHIDANNNKVLSSEEINNFLNSHGIKLPREDVDRATNNLFDTDNDGTVDLQEFLAIFTPSDKTDE